MNKNLFISHATCDKKIVEIFSNLIKRVSLNQINIWFSSDDGSNGGFRTGDNWFDTILDNLKNSQAVISFITPNSYNQPWILYESGYAAALENSKLIPVKFLIDIDRIASPLQQKQIWGLSSIEEVKEFLRKMLILFNIEFDEEVFQDTIIKSLNEMRACFEYENKELHTEENSIEELSNKVDKYFRMMFKYGNFNEQSQVVYEVSIDYVDNYDKQVTEFIKIDNAITVSDVLDQIYYFLDEKVFAHEYLETWILKEKGSNRYVVISEIQDLVPAMSIFKPQSQWSVEFLDEPYRPEKSYNKAKKYYR